MVRRAYVKSVTLQMPDKPLAERKLLAPEFDRQYNAAMQEIKVYGSLSFVGWNPDKKQEVWAIYTLRCGEVLSRVSRCMRPKDHQGDCAPRSEV